MTDAGVAEAQPIFVANTLQRTSHLPDTLTLVNIENACMTCIPKCIAASQWDQLGELQDIVLEDTLFNKVQGSLIRSLKAHGTKAMEVWDGKKTNTLLNCETGHICILGGTKIFFI